MADAASDTANRTVNARAKEAVTVLGLSAVITLTNQGWVGPQSLYREELESSRAQVHEAVLRNTLPPGVTSWKEIGGKGINARIATVWAVETLRELSGLSLSRLYLAVDTAAMLSFLLLLYWYLRAWFDPALAALGVSYVGISTPLTYLFHYFHPWDRPSQVLWVLLLIALRSGRVAVLSLLLPVSMAVKYDTILLPILYWLAHVRPRNWRTITARTAVLLVLTLGTFAVLLLAFPSGYGERRISAYVARNVEYAVSSGLLYPPLLVFGLPAALCLVAWRQVDRFSRSCVLFALGVAIILFCQISFREVRAEIPLLLLILPAALSAIAPSLSAQSSAPEPVTGNR